MFKNITFSLACFFFLSTSYSHAYFLCGSDEDGCYDYRFCACIPEIETDKEAFCLDFDKLVCLPLSQQADCYPLFIFDTQGECLATIFQSEPKPACPPVSLDFCLENHIALCDPGGQPMTCK